MLNLDSRLVRPALFISIAVLCFSGCATPESQTREVASNKAKYRILNQSEFEFDSAHFSEDGSKIISVRSDGTTSVYSTDSTTRSYRTLKRANRNTAVKAARFLASANTAVVFGRDIEVWNVPTSKKTLSIKAPRYTGTCVSKDNKKIATFSNEGEDGTPTAWVWDVNNGAKLNTLKVAAQKVECKDNCRWSCKFSPDSNNILVGSYGDILEMWNLEKSELQRTFKPQREHANAIQAIEYSPDGSKILVTNDGNMATIYEASSGDVVWESKDLGSKGDNMIGARFYPDGKRVALLPEGQPLEIVNLESKHAEFIFPGCTGRVEGEPILSVSKSGKKVLASCSEHQNTVQVWDLNNDKRSFALPGPRTEMPALMTAEFSPDESLVLTASHDGTLKLWRIQ